MSDLRHAALQARIAQEYAAGLRDFLAGAGEAARAGAYELGRRAAIEGLGLVELVTIHREALSTLLASEPQWGLHVAELAGQFLADSVAPYEMVLRAYRESARLLGLSEGFSRQNVEIDRARNQLRMILDATTAIIYLKDKEGRYLFANSRFLEVHGISCHQVIGRTDADLLPGPVAAALSGGDRGVIETGELAELEEVLPIDGEDHTFLSLKVPLCEVDGEAFAVCCVATDITERKRAGEALRAAKQATETANRELQAFSYSVAHDLRTPLHALNGLTWLLLKDDAEGLDGGQRDALRMVRDSVLRMTGLVDALLALAQVRHVELERTDVDLSALVRQASDRLRERGQDREVELVVQDGVHVEGDPRWLAVAVDNLVGNAWKFTAGREDVRIEFDADLEEAPPVYRLRDNGVGFDMGDAERLFEPFQRLHSERDFAGSGVGLATVRRVIERHGGRIWAQAEPGKGATFSFTIGPEAEA